MKKALVLSVMMVLLVAMTFPAYAAGDIAIFIDGEFLFCDVPPTIIDGRTLVPLRVIFEALDMTVDYDPTTKTITGVSPEKRIILQINSTAARVIDIGTGITTAMTLDVPAQIIDSRTLVPIRFVAESTGAGVSWDGLTRRVYVTTSGGGTEAVNDPPIALADPVIFTTDEQTPFVIAVDDLAEDTDLVTTDTLEIVEIKDLGFVINYGDKEIAPDHLSLTFTSFDISAPAIQYMIVTVTDGTHTIDVNVQIDINPIVIVIPENLAPVALADPVEFTTFDVAPLVIHVTELAADTDLFEGDELEIVSTDYSISLGTSAIAPDGESLTFTPSDVSETSTQYMTVEVTDGTHIIDVYVEITVNDFVFMTDFNFPPVPLADPLYFYNEVVVSVDQLAKDLNGDDLTIISLERLGTIMDDFGTQMIAPDGKSFSYRPDNPLTHSIQHLVARITDGTNEVDVNVDMITLGTGDMVPINMAPVPLGDLMTYMTAMDTSPATCTVHVDEIAKELDRGDPVIVSIAVQPSTVSIGTQVIAVDGKSFVFTSSASLTEMAIQHLDVTVDDGLGASVVIPVEITVTQKDDWLPY